MRETFTFLTKAHFTLDIRLAKSGELSNLKKSGSKRETDKVTQNENDLDLEPEDGRLRLLDSFPVWFSDTIAFIIKQILESETVEDMGKINHLKSELGQKYDSHTKAEELLSHVRLSSRVINKNSECLYTSFGLTWKCQYNGQPN